MEAFLAVSGYGGVSLGGELEGDEGVREPVAVDLDMQGVAVEGGELGLGAVLAGVEGVGGKGAGEPVALEEDGVDGLEDPGLSGEVAHLLELVGGVKVDDIGALGVVLVEDGGGEGLELGEVLNVLGDEDPLEVGLYEETRDRPLRFGRGRK